MKNSYTIQFNLSKKDKLFLELREAAYSNNIHQIDQFKKELKDYDLDDYVLYYQIRSNLYDKSGQIKTDFNQEDLIATFFEKYKDNAITNRLRYDWLLILAKRKDWQIFHQEYIKFPIKEDTQMRCYSICSRLVQKESKKTLNKDLRQILLYSQRFYEPCQEAMKEIYFAGGFTKDELKFFNRLAAEKNYEYSFKMIHGHDPVIDIIKSARKNPFNTYQDFYQKSWLYSKENAAISWGVIGQFLAKKLDAAAIIAYKKQHELGFHHLLSPETQEWKIRTALKEKDWILVKESIDSMDFVIKNKNPAWSYWYARALQEIGEAHLSKQIFLTLSKQFHFYAQLAREELGLKIIVPRKTTAPEALIKKISSRKGLKKAIRFYKMNLKQEGDREWNLAIKDLSDKELIAAAEYAKRLSLYDRSIITAEKTKEIHNFSLRYPMPFKNLLIPMVKLVNLDINWIYGLIKQESHFVTNAKSHVGATGLMQVMPSTAIFVAKKIGMNDFHLEKLNNIQTNLALGMHYLSMITSNLDQSHILGTAAYNAGPNRSKFWRKKIDLPIEGAIFIETIPFDETRNYVKNVLSNANYYTILNNKKAISMKEKLGTISKKE